MSNDQAWRNDPSFRDGSEAFRPEQRPSGRMPEELSRIMSVMYNARRVYDRDPEMQARFRVLTNEWMSKAP